MKIFKIFSLAILFFTSVALPLAAQVAINPDGSPPDPSAGLDVSFSNRGLLPPRVALTASNLADPVASPVYGLLVYNTATSGTEPYQVTPGYYYWKSNGWRPLSPPAGTSAGDLLYWNGTAWTRIPAGLPGQNLQMGRDHVPAWVGATYPAVTTGTQVINITTSSATCSGEVTSDGGSGVYARGICYDTAASPSFSGSHTSEGSGTGSFSTNLTGLLSEKTYHIRAYAMSNIGTVYGADVSFTTLRVIEVPTVTTTPATNITQTTATSGGNVTSQGGDTVSARGVCWSSTHTQPTLSDPHTSNGYGTGVFTSPLTGLTPGTQYYVRAYATNSGGTGYGSTVTFTTSSSGGGGGTPCPGMATVSYGGVTYNTVLIGTQCWLKENLNVGVQINGAVDQTNNNIVEKYCYDNLASNCAIYGGLYQWAEAVQYLNGATNTSSWTPPPAGFVIGICPPGWHIPTLNDWNTLLAFLGGASVAGGKLKEAGLVHWAAPNTGATNESGFTGLPGGRRDIGGTFSGLTLFGYHWSSTEAGPTSAYEMKLDFSTAAAVLETENKAKGLSVRCLRNN